ncbi:hypothetical protein BGZ75_001523 [Mortierella antarctica]|nr:hypothetical protein BGZ75_001523 [Mortierella antarctica]
MLARKVATAKQTKGRKGKTLPSNAVPRTEITTTTTTTVSTITKVDAPRTPSTRPTTPHSSNVPRKRAGSPQESTPSASGTKKRRTIPLALKADFINEYLSGRALDPPLSAASVGKREKYNFSASYCSRLVLDQENILSKARDEERWNKGLKQSIREAIKQVVADPKYKHYFKPGILEKLNDKNDDDDDDN